MCLDANYNAVGALASFIDFKALNLGVNVGYLKGMKSFKLIEMDLTKFLCLINSQHTVLVEKKMNAFRLILE